MHINNTCKDNSLRRLKELVSRYDEIFNDAVYSGERIHTIEDIAYMLPEDINCRRDIEIAIEKAYFDYLGYYEPIPYIINCVRETDDMIQDNTYIEMAA